MSLQQLLSDIKQHNQKIYDKTLPYEKIDFFQTKKNWGIDIIPKKYHIDVSKKYKTVDGQNVSALTYVLKNSANREATYPIKGSIIFKQKGKSDKLVYSIWTLDGRYDVTKNEHKYNLIKIKGNQNDN